ncbi:MAG: class I SAM-dependent methyltransferase [Bacteroidales bacterium]|nr:class I SAM-dependent methyltransferase [Bacteroidales bacterium]MCF8336468.1 class I SAM-dependent methyltransferase [Bacteroidales bacterium]
MDEYRKFAGVYDILLYPFLHSVRVKTTHIASQLQPKSIIDICCGTGKQLKYLKSHGFENLEGIDLSVSMLNQTQKGENPVNCREGDATAMDIPDNSYDMGIISYALHEKPKETAQQIVREATRIIRPSGYLLVVDYAPDNAVNSLAKGMVHAVERIAGKDHYHYFKKYNQYKGMDGLLPAEKLDQLHGFNLGTSQLRVYKM